MPRYVIEVETNIVFKISELELLTKEVEWIIEDEYNEDCTVTAKYD